jgi:hypothetical protein
VRLEGLDKFKNGVTFWIAGQCLNRQLCRVSFVSTNVALFNDNNHGTVISNVTELVEALQLTLHM